jgi:hypothetical protein
MMRRFILVLSAIFLLLLVAGCSSLAYTPAPTPYPVDYIPTLIAQTVESGRSDVPTPSPVIIPTDTPSAPTPTPETFTATYGPSPTPPASDATVTASLAPSFTSTIDPKASPTRRPTRTPTLTPTPPIPNAGVQIHDPGPMSKVASPLELVANAHSIPSGTYHTEIWLEPLQPGGDARLLFREIKKLISNPIDWIYLDPDIAFELERVSELAQLRIGVYDQFGRPVSINSQDLILLSMGPSELTPTGDLSEPLLIRQPTPNQLIQGGTVIVSGLAKPSEASMLVELVASDGSVVGFNQLILAPAPDGSYVPYAVEVPYTVSTGTWVRLRISESGVRIPGIEHLSSVEVYLSP